MDVLKREKENQKDFHCNDIANEICGSSRRQIFIMEKSLLQLKIEEENQSNLMTLGKYPHCVKFRNFT